MSDLKLLQDRVLKAQADLAEVKNQIFAALALGTPEGDEQALELEAKHDEAVASEKRWHDFYDKTVAEARNVLEKFVPVQPQDIPVDGENPKAMKRAEFNNLTPADRMKFIRNGGKLED